jgi:hypothetical protein
MMTERLTRVARGSKDLAAVKGLQPNTADNILGSYCGSGIGKLTFTAASNLQTRPKCKDLPWLCWLHGDIKPVVAHLGEGRYAACLEYRAWTREGEAAADIQYGYPFRLEKMDSGDSLQVTGMYMGGSFVLHRA